MAEQKKAPSTNGEFKTSPLGFDKAEVMAYIVQQKNSRRMKVRTMSLQQSLKRKRLNLTHRSLKAESRFLTKDASWLRPKKNCTLCRTNTLP